MSLAKVNGWSPEFQARLRANEVVTVRCGNCRWAYTGLSFRTSKRGNETGALARGRAHAERCADQRERRNARQRRLYWRQKAQGKRRERLEYHRAYYAANAERIQARRRARRGKAR